MLEAMEIVVATGVNFAQFTGTLLWDIGARIL